MPRKDAITHLGLEYYLNQPHSIVRHGGHSYDDFVRAVDLPSPLRVNKARLAEMFNVSRPTVDKWVKLWEEERTS